MGKYRKLTSFTVLFSMIFMLIFAPIAPVVAVAAQNGEENITQNEVKDYNALVQAAINDASANMLKEGVNSEWQAIGLTKAGKTVPAGYTDTFKQNIADQITKGLDTGRFKITDSERLAMAAVAIGIDPQDVGGHNLIELIYNSPDRKLWDGTVEDTLTYQGNNGIIFALIALDTKGFTVPANARWTRDKMVAELLKNQKDDGAWSLSTTTTGSTSYDITAMALIGLAPYTGKPEVKKAVDKAIAFLSKEQGPTGGFDEAFVGGISSEATSQVIIGLTANKIDPTSDKFTKNGINLIDHLLSFQVDNGGFKHTSGEKSSNSMATEQALQGLVAFDLYKKGAGRLYDFADKVVEPEPTPEPNPEPEPTPDPEPEPTPDPEPTPEVDNVIGFDKQHDVIKGKKFIIGNKDSKSNLVMPSDLPEGTKLEVSLPDKEKTPFNDLELAGDWFDFKFHYPEGMKKGTESFELTMAVHDGINVEKTGIYYFNEQTKEWSYVGGWGSAKDGAITVEVDHFSIYGVFTDTTGPTNIKVTEKSTTLDSITLGLSANDPSGIKEYIISQEDEQIVVVDGSETEFLDADLKANQAYDYTVIAVDELGNESEKVSFTAKTAEEKVVVDNDNNAAPDENESNLSAGNDTDKGTDKVTNTEKVTGTDTVKDKGKLLPKTATNTFNLLLIGVGLLTVGGIALLFIRRKNILGS